MISFKGLLIGEIKLTFDIILGILLGEIFVRILQAKLSEKFLNFIRSHTKLNPVIALSVAVSTGSSRTGAGIISQALEKNMISENESVWGVLMLPFPSYLKRWFSTFALSVSIAGIAGGFFALFLLIRSALRFFTAFFVLTRKYENKIKNDFSNEIFGFKNSNVKSRIKKTFLKQLFKNLTLGWIFFALTYSLIPTIDNFLKGIFFKSTFFKFMPLSGWTIAAGSVVNVSAALSLAGGTLSSGELNNAQVLFMLILGSAFGTVTRILRQNAGYYFGMFKSRLAIKMLILNFLTILPFIIFSVIISGLAML